MGSFHVISASWLTWGFSRQAFAQLHEAPQLIQEVAVISRQRVKAWPFFVAAVSPGRIEASKMGILSDGIKWGYTGDRTNVN